MGTPPLSSKETAPDTTRPSKIAEDGKTRIEQDGESVPRLPHERDQTSGAKGTQDHQDDHEETKTGIGKKAYDDVVGDTVDTSYAPMTDKVYNDKVKP